MITKAKDNTEGENLPPTYDSSYMQPHPKHSFHRNHVIFITLLRPTCQCVFHMMDEWAHLKSQARKRQRSSHWAVRRGSYTLRLCIKPCEPNLNWIYVRICFTCFKILFTNWVQETKKRGASSDAAVETRQLEPQLQCTMLMMSAHNHLKNSSRSRGWSPSLVHETKIELENLYI